MSVRSVGVRLFNHGRSLVQHFCKRDLNTTIISNKTNARPQRPTAAALPKVPTVSGNYALRNVGVQIGLQARRILIDNVLSRVTNSLSGELRRKATRRILFGDSAPFFAFVGVSLASGSGILTKEEELEGVCWEIREAVAKINWGFMESAPILPSESITLDDLTLGSPIAKGSNGVVYSAQLKGNLQSNEQPFALKMMFNYDIQSNSMEILKAMNRETIPARNFTAENDWQVGNFHQTKTLPAHPNVVAIHHVFTDYIRAFEGSRNLYPAALPRRLHEEGEGRNMSLFLLMKYYDTSLQDFLKSPQNPRTSVLLFTQLLEGIAHLSAHGVAHRDLKSDNILLDTSESDCPILVISDFGCCLADKQNGLLLPYMTPEIDKGGNAALMAPEIILQRPGTFSVLNYTRSDLWAAGALAYEIFGGQNPFYKPQQLRNVTYKEDELPKLPRDTPDIIQTLVGNLLQRNPNKDIVAYSLKFQRLNPEVAANVCQLFLWAPSSWLKKNFKLPTSSEILQWLLSLTTKVLCEGKFNNQNSGLRDRGRRTYPEYLLISSFLSRAKLSNIRAALQWIQRNCLEVDY